MMKIPRILFLLVLCFNPIINHAHRSQGAQLDTDENIGSLNSELFHSDQTNEETLIVRTPTSEVTRSTDRDRDLTSVYASATIPYPSDPELEVLQNSKENENKVGTRRRLLRKRSRRSRTRMLVSNGDVLQVSNDNLNNKVGETPTFPTNEANFTDEVVVDLTLPSTTSIRSLEGKEIDPIIDVMPGNSSAQTYEDDEVATSDNSTDDGTEYDDAAYDDAAYDDAAYDDAEYDDAEYDDAAYDDDEVATSDNSTDDGTEYDDAEYDDAEYDDAEYDDAEYDDAAYEDAEYDDAEYDDAKYDDAEYDDAKYDDAEYDDAAYEDAAYDDYTGDEYSGDDYSG
jgi:hypothetical protein